MPDELKTVATYTTPIEADMARNRLEASGIRAFLGDDQTVGWLWHLGTALSGVKVLVAERDLPRAREILQSVEASRGQGRVLPWSCPKCGAEVDGEMDICWACGTTADGLEDAEFQDADAPPTTPPAGKAEPKGPPSAALALLIAFCIPMYVFNTLVGFDVFFLQAARPVSSGLMLLALLAGDLLLVVGLFHWFYYRPPAPAEAEGPAERLPARADTAVAEQEAPEPAIDLEAIARRACLAALLGMVLCPLALNLYSIWLIVRYDLCRPDVRRRFSSLVYTAILINVIACLVPLMLFLAMGGAAVP